MKHNLISTRRRILKTIIGTSAVATLASSGVTAEIEDSSVTREEDLIARWPFQDGFEDLVGGIDADIGQGDPTVGSYDDRLGVALDGDDALIIGSGSENPELSFLDKTNDPTTIAGWIYFDQQEGGSPVDGPPTDHHIFRNDAEYKLLAHPINKSDVDEIKKELSTGRAEWQVTETPDGTTGKAEPIRLDPDWVVAPDDSEWVDAYGTGREESDPVGTYQYEIQFTTDKDNNVVHVEKYASDDESTLYLNEREISSHGFDDSTPYKSYKGPVLVPIDSGEHTLRAVVENSGGGPTGFLLSGDIRENYNSIVELNFNIADYGSGGKSYSLSDNTDSELYLYTKQWHHFAIIIHPANSIKCFINGEQVFIDESMEGYSPRTTDYWSHQTIGSWYGTGSPDWYELLVGKLSDFRIYEDELSDDEIKEIYRNTSGDDSYRFANADGYVDSDGLLDAGVAFRNGEITEDRLNEIASAFRSGEPLS